MNHLLNEYQATVIFMEGDESNPNFNSDQYLNRINEVRDVLNLNEK